MKYGMALIQAILIGIGFFLADIPYAGIWTLLVFLLGVLQIPPVLVLILVAVYLFSEKSLVAAVAWTVYLLSAGLSDNILKPILLGQGASVPMLVIFLGVIGGFARSGFIGLFTGAIVMSIGYKLFIAWINTVRRRKISENDQKYPIHINGFLPLPSFLSKRNGTSGKSFIHFGEKGESNIYPAFVEKGEIVSARSFS
jgi:predicted PurR-regulated permease PerM